MIWTVHAVCIRPAGQSHSPDCSPGNWSLFFRSATGIFWSFLMVVQVPFVLPLLCYKLVGKAKEMSDCFPHKYPFETGFRHKPVLTDCSSTGKPDCKNLWPGDLPLHSTRAVLVVKWDAIDKKQNGDRRPVFALPMITKPPLPFLLFICFAEQPHLQLAVKFTFLRQKQKPEWYADGLDRTCRMLCTHCFSLATSLWDCWILSSLRNRGEMTEMYPTGLTLRGVYRWLCIYTQADEPIDIKHFLIIYMSI